jgi:hypothetical protein
MKRSQKITALPTSFVRPPTFFPTAPRALFLGLLVLGAVVPARPSTSFCLADGDSIVFGRNYDVYAADGRVMVNRRGLRKTAFGTNSGLRWVSRFGSVTFNQFGHEFPSGGINEVGLVVEVMAFEAGQYPDDQRPGLTDFQWVQYQLDCSATVEDVLGSDQRIRIQRDASPIPLHFLVSDRTGRSAVVEFIGGRLVGHTGNSLVVAALSNHTYEASLAYAATTPPAMADHVSSLGRFVHAAAAVRSFPEARSSDPVGYAFAALDAVRQPTLTQWSIVYDIRNLSVHFRTLSVPLTKKIRLAALDFSPDAPIRMMDINANSSGEVSPQTIYSQADNLEVLASVRRQTPPLASYPLSYLQLRAAFPETVVPAPRPSISVHPESQTVAPGGNATFRVAATSSEGDLAYQWHKDGTVIAAANGAELTVANLTASHAGDYTVVVSTAFGGTAESRLARLLVATPEPGRLVNLSVRSSARSRNSPLIVGFVVSGGGKSLLIRATGPALARFGVSQTLPDPCLDLHATVNGQDTVAASNDNWGSDDTTALRTAFSATGAFALADAASLDAALLSTVDGLRTVSVYDTADRSGVTLVEVYDAGTDNAQRLVNESARNFVGTGDNVLVAGFVVSGNTPKKLLLRAIGPRLAAFGVPGVLADPKLELYHAGPGGGSVLFASNDNWGSDAEAGLRAAFAATGAFDLPDAASKDAALLLTLPAGSYTAQVSGVAATTGEALVEVYEVP